MVSYTDREKLKYRLTVSIPFEESVYDQIMNLCNKKDLKKTQIIRRAVKEFLEREDAIQE